MGHRWSSTARCRDASARMNGAPRSTCDGSPRPGSRGSSQTMTSRRRSSSGSACRSWYVSLVRGSVASGRLPGAVAERSAGAYDGPAVRPGPGTRRRGSGTSTPRRAARVSEDDRHVRVADLELRHQLARPAGPHPRGLERAIALLDDHRGRRQRGQLGELEAELPSISDLTRSSNVLRSTAPRGGRRRGRRNRRSRAPTLAS